MKIHLLKVDSGRRCCHASCKGNSQYITPKGRIKKGTVVARITHRVMGSRWQQKEMSFYYCRECIDQLFLDCRTHFDTKLWAFL